MFNHVPYISRNHIRLGNVSSITYFKIGRVLDLNSNISPTTLSIKDVSGSSNDAFLYTGRYVSLDGAGDSVEFEDLELSDIPHKVVGRAKSSSDTLYRGQIGGISLAATIVANNTWQDFEVSFSGVTANITTYSIGTDGMDTFEGGLSDIRILDSGGNNLHRVLLADHVNNVGNSLNGLQCLNKHENKNHGAYVQCAGFTGEPTILQTAGMDFNEYAVFNGVDSYVDYSEHIADFSALTKGRISGTFNVKNTGTFQQIVGSSDDTNASSDLGIRILHNGLFHFLIRVSDNILLRWDSTASYNDGKTHTFDITMTDSGSTILIDGIAGVGSYLNGNSSTTKWFSDVADLNGLLVGANKDSGGLEGLSNGFIEDVKIYAEDATTLLLSSLGRGDNPWKDTSGNGNDGTESGTFLRPLVPVSDTDPTLDAYGNALTFQRTPKTLNLTDGASAQIAAPVPDTIKTVANWIWHDGTAKTHIDGGNWTVGSTTTALTSTGFTGAAYFVNGVSGTTLSAGWNHVMVASTAELTTADIDFTNVQAHFLAYITTEGADTALQNYTATKSDYGL